jgi:hypothetical protein
VSVTGRWGCPSFSMRSTVSKRDGTCGKCGKAIREVEQAYVEERRKQVLSLEVSVSLSQAIVYFHLKTCVELRFLMIFIGSELFKASSLIPVSRSSYSSSVKLIFQRSMPRNAQTNPQLGPYIQT